MGVAVLLSPVAAFAQPAQNAVTGWAAIVQPGVVAQRERTYDDLNALMSELDNAPVRGGLHWRHAMRHGPRWAARSTST